MEDESDLHDNRLFFLQCNKILNRHMPAVDRVGKALNCIHLRKKGTPVKSDLLSAGQTFGLVLTGSINEIA